MLQVKVNVADGFAFEAAETTPIPVASPLHNTFAILSTNISASHVLTHSITKLCTDSHPFVSVTVTL